MLLAKPWEALLVASPPPLWQHVVARRATAGALAANLGLPAGEPPLGLLVCAEGVPRADKGRDLPRADPLVLVPRSPCASGSSWFTRGVPEAVDPAMGVCGLSMVSL